MIAAVMIILGPLMMSLPGVIPAADYRGWREAAAKAHGGVWNAGCSRAYTTFRYVGLMAAWRGAVFAVGATALVIFIYAR
ncbi:hypothetical protein ABT099_25860 [Streptomyces prasinus]|uniref:hypothetical protein n=1 Tax=Streptomyces prasinus TaxID=67345 RepID=UPI003330A7C4